MVERMRRPDDDDADGEDEEDTCAFSVMFQLMAIISSEDSSYDYKRERGGRRSLKFYYFYP